MALSNDIVSLFVKATNDRDKKSKESTAYGTVKIQGDRTYVKIDGSDQLTPVSTVTNTEDGERVTVLTTTNMVDGERVTVRIKDHTATVIGNNSSPAARTEEVEEVSKKVGYFDIVYTQKIDAVNGEITNLKTEYGEFKQIVTDDLEAKNATIENLTVKNLEIENKVTASEAEIDELQVDNAVIQEAVIKDLTAEDGTVKNLTSKFANIDFANIGEAAIKNFYATSGVIKDVVISDGHVTGTLVGVTIKGDLIEGGTVVADKLVIRGEDGLYYKLNALGISENSHTNYVKMDTVVTPGENGSLVENALTSTSEPVYSYADSEGNEAYYTIVDGVCYAVELSTSSVQIEQTDYNSLNGSVITAKSVTATQISVDDLVAFDATIGGFKIDDNAIRTVSKDAVDAVTTGVYMDSDGQFATGDGSNFFKFYKDDDDNFRLEISATSIMLSKSQTDLETELSDTNNKIVETSDNLSQEIEGQKTDYQAFLAKFSKYIRFMEDENGDPSDTAILIGSGDSAITLELDNETGIIFKKNGVQFGWWDGVDFHTGNIVVDVNERAQFGNFAFVPRSDGSLSFLKVGG